MKANQKKILRKVTKCVIGISKDVQLKLTKDQAPSKYVLLCNAGLVTGFTREDLFALFSPFGVIERVLMIPGKSYSFVSFSSVDDSEICVNNLNGSLSLENGTLPLYLCFVEDINNELIEKDKSLTKHWPDGLKLFQDFVSEEEEASLLQSITWDSEPASNLKHRKVKHYGYAFLYETSNIDKQNPLPGGLPNEMGFLIHRIMDSKVMSVEPDQLTCNQYLPGQGIPSHVDTHSAFGDEIISLSLGSSSVMDFKHPDGRHSSVLLPRRSCLLMSGEARYVWSHGITPRKMDIVEAPSGGLTLLSRDTRTSLTFRKIRESSECHCTYKNCCDSQLKNASKILEDSADDIEKTHVFQVYNQIASHFSDTRHKPWPNVLEFVQSFPIGSVLVDVGCGNGKYLGHSPSVYNIGCDRSWNLLQVCRDREHEAVNADCRSTPLRDGIADAVICIAVIHHLATESRRLQAIQDITRLLGKGGKALIYVWAKEQEHESKKSTYLLQQKNEKAISKGDSFCGSSILPVHENRTDFKHADVLVPWKLNPKTPSLKESTSSKEETSFLRYYHVFTEGELETLCAQVTDVTVVKSYYDQGNWCVVIEKVG